MPAQPLSNARRDLLDTFSWQDILYSQEALGAQPELAGLAMRVIGIWSQGSALLLGMATKLLESQHAIVMAMLLAIDNHKARRDAIFAAAEKRLEKSDYLLFCAAMGSTKASEDVRHSFAHYLWFYSRQYLPDSLLLVDPKYFATYGAGMEAALTTPPFNLDDYMKTARVDFGQIYEWKRENFNEAIRDAERALVTMQNLFLLVARYHSKDQSPADPIRQQLLADPEIARRFQKLSRPPP